MKPNPNRPLIVLDTLVVVSAIIGSAYGASFALLKAVETGDLELAVSDDWLRELVRVLEYPRIATQINADLNRPARAFRIALGIGLMGSFFRPRRLDWLGLKDPNDGWIFDLAHESGANFIVSRDGRVLEAGLALNVEVLEPAQALERIKSSSDP